MSKFKIGLIGCFGMMIQSAAFADTTIVFKDTGGGETGAGRMEISGGMIRAQDNDDPENYMIFDGNKNEFIAINASDRSYIVFGKEQIQQLADMQNQVMKQMEAQLAQLPAAQREQMKQMMSSMMPPGMGESKPRRYERSGKKEVAGYDCYVTQIYAGDQKTSELCIAEPGELDMNGSDYQTLKSFQEFTRALAESVSTMSDGSIDFGDPEREGIPIQYTRHTQFAGTMNGELQSINDDSIDAARFQIPAGYKQQKLPTVEELF